MSRPAITLKQAAGIYKRLRKRYFLHAEPPLHVPPPVNEIRFTWLPDNSDAIGETYFDEDGDPFEIRLNHKLCRYTIARETILHELVHMRLGAHRSCGGHSHAWNGARIAMSMAWHKETVRLAEAGAIHL